MSSQDDHLVYPVESDKSSKGLKTAQGALAGTIPYLRTTADYQRNHIEFRLKTYAIDENITSIGIGFED